MEGCAAGDPAEARRQRRLSIPTPLSIFPTFLGARGAPPPRAHALRATPFGLAAAKRRGVRPPLYFLKPPMRRRLCCASIPRRDSDRRLWPDTTRRRRR